MSTFALHHTKMITVIPLVDASVLIIGGGNLANEILRNLKSRGM
jgi:siroheme synthase (precorrin-2 oxidase/ferrochelatase)